jgi:hypothetical protein
MIAVVNLTNRIIYEVNSYRSAPHQFQRLSIELGFISKVCTQILSLEPSIPSGEDIITSLYNATRFLKSHSEFLLFRDFLRR